MFRRRPLNWHRLFSIRNALALPIVVVFIAYFSISMFFYVQNTTRLVTNFLETYSSAISNNINIQLDDFFNEATGIVQENSHLIETGILQVDDKVTLSKYFLNQLTTSPFMTYVSIGYPNGEYIGAARLVDSGELRLFESSEKKGYLMNAYEVDENFNPIRLVKSGPVFKATTREWYKEAIQLGEMSWYPVYKYAAQEALGIGVSAPIYDKLSGELLGVLTADLALNQVSSFLKTLDFGEKGIVFVAEEEGNLVGISNSIPLYKETTSEFNRTNLNLVSNDLIKMAVDDQNHQNGSMNFELNNEKYHYNHIHYFNIKNQAFFIGVILSYSDFSSNYQSSLYHYTGVAIVVFLILTLSLVMILRLFILPPIDRLIEGYGKVKLGDFSHKIKIKGNYEAKILSEAFNDMMAFLDKSKKMEQEYIALEKFAALGAMVSGVTHEINTPLGLSITMGSHLEELNKQIIQAFESGKITKQQFNQYLLEVEEAVGILNRNLFRTAELVTSFKALSVGQSLEQEVLFSMCELIDYVKISLKHAYRKAGHRIELQCDQSIKLYGYPGSWTQILTNLIMNSIIHGFKNKQEGIITICFYRIEDEFVLEYRDNGRGMNQEVKEKIFQPFFTTNRENGGTGIGMSIVYELVTNRLKGSIALTSEPEKGVTFILKVPDRKEG